MADRMTLREWSDKYGYNVHINTKTGQMYIHEFWDDNSTARWDLFHLEDVIVSTISAGVLWLIDRF